MRVIVIFLTFLFISSCKDRCRTVECKTNDLYLKLRIVDKHTEKNLLYGPDRKYNIDSLKIEYLTTHQIIPIERGYNFVTKDSIISCNPFEPQEFILYYNYQERDTFNITVSETTASECCPSVREMNVLTGSGMPSIKDNDWTFTLKK